MARVAILHYAAPPTVGGVESTIAYHARGLVEQNDIDVRVVSGEAESFDDRIEMRVEPLFGSKHPEVLRVKAQLDRGEVTADFHALVDQLITALRETLADCDVCIAHNIPSLNKNLPLTAALARYVAEGHIRLVAWCHDLAWTNPQYLPELHEGYPYDLLRQAWPGVRYVTVSEARHTELAELLNLPPKSIAVVVPGVDPARFFHWSLTMEWLEKRLNLLDADGLLLLPARITRRKNIEMGLRILGEVRRITGTDYRLIVTGPPGPHNPANPGYLGELLALRQDLSLEHAAHFLYECGPSNDEPLIPDDDTIANLYQAADALLFPTAQEGFGIPILEAGLAGIPAFCADIPPLRLTGENDAQYFDPVVGDPAEIAAQIVHTLESSPVARLRRRVRQHYRWSVIIRDQVVPLLGV